MGSVRDCPVVRSKLCNRPSEAKTITPSLTPPFHVAPRGAGAAVRLRRSPPRTDTVRSRPPAKKPRVVESGDQNGRSAWKVGCLGSRYAAPIGAVVRAHRENVAFRQNPMPIWAEQE